MRDADLVMRKHVTGSTWFDVLMIKFVLTVVMMPTALKLVEVVRLTQLLDLLALPFKVSVTKDGNELATEDL